MGAAWGKIPKVALLFRKEFGCLGNLAINLKKLGPTDTYRIPFKKGEQLWNLNRLNTVSVNF